MVLPMLLPVCVGALCAGWSARSLPFTPACPDAHIQENDLSEDQKKRDGIEADRTAAYNKYGFSSGHTLAQRSTQEAPPTQRNTGARSRLHNHGRNNVYLEDCSPPGQTSVLHSEQPAQSDAMVVRKNMTERNYYDNSNLKLQTALKDSESHRQALACKLEETRSVVEKQNDQLRKIESAAIDNSFLMENLKFKEMEFRKAIDHFEVSVKEKHLLQLRNLQLKEDIQERVEAIDFQLRNIKRQQLIKGTINTSFSDSPPFALSMLKEENTKLQQDKVALSRRVQEMAEEMRQLRSLLQIVKDENENLFAKWTACAEDKVQASKQVEECQNTVSDLKSRLSSVTAAKDKLLQEKLQVSQKLQQMVLDKEEISKERDKMMKAMENSHSKTETERSQEEYRKLQKELCILKHEYGLLNTKHAYFVNRYGDDGNEKKEKQEMTKMRTERDALLKQVTFLHNQLSQAEDSKRQADDQLTRLSSELEDAKAELTLSSSSHKVNAPGDIEEENSLKQQLEMLRKHMNEFREYDCQQEQEYMMKNHKEYSPHNKGEDAFHCKSFDLDLSSDSPGSTEPSKTQQKGHYGGCFFNLPEKSETDENNRLQNLISKYGSEI